jgi:hypothetical protein
LFFHSTGDQTLYSDGGNFDNKNSELALALIRLLCHGTKVVLVTAAGYGFDGSKYEVRIQELLNRFIEEQMNENQIENFFVLGGECHYLMQCKLVNTDEEVNEAIPQEAISDCVSVSNSTIPSRQTSATELSGIQENDGLNGNNNELKFEIDAIPAIEGESGKVVGGSEKKPSTLISPTIIKSKNAFRSLKAKLVAVPVTSWQAEHLPGPKPFYWPDTEVNELLDIAENTMKQAVEELKLRAKTLRKPKAVGVFPGGKEMSIKCPVGHGSRKLKQEALDEVVLRVNDAIRRRHSIKPFSLPYCVFNGGTDAWIDIGNKSVGVAALQAYFNCKPAECLHVGDQVSFSEYCVSFFCL